MLYCTLKIQQIRENQKNKLMKNLTFILAALIISAAALGQTGYDSTVAIKIVSNFPRSISGNTQELKSNSSVHIVNLQNSAVEFAIQTNIIGDGWGLTSNPKTKRMMKLAPFETFVINSLTWSSVVDLMDANFMGVTKSRILADGFPEGKMNICLTAVAADNEALSAQECQTVEVKNQETAVILGCGTTIFPNAPEGVFDIMWIPSGCPGVLYNVIMKIVPAGEDLKTVMSSPKYPVAYMDIITMPDLSVKMGDISGCKVGTTIGVVIKHFDPSGKNIFRNHAWSEPCSFIIGTPVKPASKEVVKVTADSVSKDTARVKPVVSEKSDSLATIETKPAAIKKSDYSSVKIKTTKGTVEAWIKLKKGDDLNPGTGIKILVLSNEKPASEGKKESEVPALIIDDYKLVVPPAESSEGKKK